LPPPFATSLSNKSLNLVFGNRLSSAAAAVKAERSEFILSLLPTIEARVATDR